MVNDNSNLAERVANLEAIVAQLQAQLEPQKTHWLKRMRGGINDVEAFEEAMRLGREYRQSFRDDAPADPMP